MCAPCHARRVKLSKDLIPGLNFEDQYLVQNISSDFYHLDGQILEEDYVYGSFTQSRMFVKGIKCNDCHNVHSGKLLLEGNQLCLQCHKATDYDTFAHTHHKKNGEKGEQRGTKGKQRGISLHLFIFPSACACDASSATTATAVIGVRNVTCESSLSVTL